MEKHIKRIKRTLLLQVAALHQVTDVQRRPDQPDVVVECQVNVAKEALSQHHMDRLRYLCKEALQSAGYADIQELCEQDQLQSESILPSSQGNDTVGSGDDHVLSKFDVSGMTCASCTNTISNALQAMDGVVSVSVTLLTRVVAIKHRRSVTATELLQRIQDCGFEGHVITESAAIPDLQAPTAYMFSVTGMTCTACVSAIEQHLRSMSGIQSCSVNLLRHTALVNLDPTVTGIRAVCQTIEDLGYEAKYIPHEKRSVQSSSAEQQLEDNVKQEEQRLRARLIWCCVFAVPMFVVSMLGMMLLPLSNPFHQWLMQEVVPGLDLGSLISAILATPVQLGLGRHFYRGAWQSLRYARTPNMDVLVVVGTAAAYLSSWVSISLNMSHGQMLFATYFETSVFLFTFIYLGKYLESVAKRRTTAFLSALLRRRTDRAILVELPPESIIDSNDQNWLEHAKETELDATLLVAGDVVKVPPHRLVPCDGIVLYGRSSVDESLLTGESRPISKSKGDVALCGTTNQAQSLYIRAVRVGSETTLQRIYQLVEEAQTRKSSMQRIADRIASKFVWLVLFLAMMDFIIWFSVGSSGQVPLDWLPPGFTPTLFALQFTIAVLVIACPCALGLATPTAVMIGCGVAARCGILVKEGGEAMEKAVQIDAIVFDKTGTLTFGRPTVLAVDVLCPDGFDWSNVEAVVRHSEHPLSQALREYAVNQRNDGAECIVRDVIEHPGRGVQATCQKDGCIVYVGSERWMLESLNASITPSIKDRMNEWRNSGHTVVLVGCQRKSQETCEVAAIVSLLDGPRPESPQVIRRLHEMNIETYILSGDSLPTALSVAKQVGIPEEHVYAGVLPDQKATTIQHIQRTARRRHLTYSFRRWTQPLSRSRSLSQDVSQCGDQLETGQIQDSARVMMVGDGVNDAVALAQADIGVSLGSGADLAMSTASVVLMKSDLMDLLHFLQYVHRFNSYIFMWCFV